jgi:hypothetical protein
MCAVFIRPVCVRAPSICTVQYLHEVQNLYRRPPRPEPLRDLNDAPGVRCDDGLGMGFEHVRDLSIEEACRHLGPGHVVGAGGAAAPVGLVEVDEPEPGDLGEQPARLQPDLWPWAT